MPKSRQVGAHAGGQTDDVGSEKDEQYRPKAQRSDKGKSGEMRYQSGGTEMLVWVSLVILFCQL